MPSQLASQLAQQLGRGGKGPALRSAVSLLFTPSVAADLGDDEVLSLAHEGLEALVLSLTSHHQSGVDAVSSLESVSLLLGPSFRTYDRALQTPADNEGLDKLLSSALRSLSPHFMNPNAFKVLEWLVRRFRIHQYNIDAFMECALPYHDSRQFVLVCSILALSEDNASRWSFLTSVKAKKIPLDRASLVTVMLRDPSLLTFISESLQACRAAGLPHPALVSFYACTMVQFVQTAKPLTEDMLRPILPSLLAFLRSRGSSNADLQIAAQMIACAIASKVILTPDMIEELMIAICRGSSVSIKSAVMTLMAIPAIRSFPRKALLSLLGSASCASVIARLLCSYDTPEFSTALLVSCARELVCLDTVNGLILNAELATSIIEPFLDQLFRSLIENEATSSEELDEDVVSQLLRSIQVKHSKALERQFVQSFQTHGPQVVFDRVSRHFHSALTVPHGETSLFLALHDSDASIRGSALSALRVMVEAGELKDPHFLPDYIMRQVREEDGLNLTILLDLAISSVTDNLNLDVIVKALLSRQVISIKESARIILDFAVKALNKIPKSEDCMALLLAAIQILSDDSESEIKISMNLTNLPHAIQKWLKKGGSTSTFMDVFERSADSILVQRIFALKFDGAIPKTLSAIYNETRQKLLCRSSLSEAQASALLCEWSFKASEMYLVELLQKSSATTFTHASLVKAFFSLMAECSSALPSLFNVISDPLSFLVSLWTVEQPLHSATLDLSLIVLESMNKAKNDTFDFQMLIPKGLCALMMVGDNPLLKRRLFAIFKHIRRCIAQADKKTPLFKLSYVLSVSGIEQVQRLNKSGVVDLMDVICGQAAEVELDTNVLNLSNCSSDALRFLCAMVPLLSESDQIYLINALKFASSPKTFKNLCDMLDTCSDSIFEAVVALIDLHTASALLNSKKTLGSMLAVFSAPKASEAKKLALAMKLREYFTTLENEKQSMVIELLAEKCWSALETLGDCFTPTFLVPHAKLIGSALEGISSITMSSGKRSKVTPKEEDSEKSQEVLDRTMAFLDVLDSKNLSDCSALIQPLFCILEGLCGLGINESVSSLDYIKTKALSILCSLTAEPISFAVDGLRVDVVVQCLRLSDNPQTHKEALLLLSSIARLYPQETLLHVMPIFTFMGTSVLLQDDAYSQHVIEMTMRALLPALPLSSVADILLVFVNAYQHIPKHRRFEVFIQLSKNVGRNALAKILTLLLEKGVHHMDEKKSTGAIVEVVIFCRNLLNHFPIMERLTTVNQLLAYASISGEKNTASSALSDLLKYGNSVKSVARTQMAIIDFISGFLSCKTFVRDYQILGSETVNTVKGGVQAVLLDLHSLVLRMLVEYLIADERVTESESKKAFFQSAQAGLRNVLKAAQGLTSLPEFLGMIESLLEFPADLQMQTLELLASKAYESTEEGALFLPILSVLQGKVEDFKVEKSNGFLLVSYLDCISTLATLFASSHQGPYFDVLQVVTKFADVADPSAMKAQAQCMLQLCEQLEIRVLPLLPVLTSKLRSWCATSSSAAFAPALNIWCCLLQNCSKFIPSLHLSFLLEVALGAFAVGGKVMQDNVGRLQASLLGHISPKTLFPLFRKLQDKLDVGASFMFLDQMIKVMSKDDLMVLYIDIFKLFVAVFDKITSSKIQGANSAEESVHIAFISFTMKMSEELFRPLFSVLVEWIQKHQSTAVGFFFRLVGKLSSKLQFLFTSYHLMLTDFTVDTLSKLRMDRSDTDEADAEFDEKWVLLVTSLSSLCANDKNLLLDDEKRSSICNALLAQLDICPDEASLVTAFGALAQDADSIRKPLHSGLLMKTRSSDASVRTLCCKSLRQVWSVVGEDMLTLFPESLPFLAELLEDTSTEVERETQQLCLVIQQYLGEDISTYFSQ